MEPRALQLHASDNSYGLVSRLSYVRRAIINLLLSTLAAETRLQ